MPRTTPQSPTRLVHVVCGKEIFFQKRSVSSQPCDEEWPLNTDVEVPFCAACSKVVDVSTMGIPDWGLCTLCKHNGQCGIQAVQVNSLVQRKVTGCIGAFEPKEDAR